MNNTLLWEEMEDNNSEVEIQKFIDLLCSWGLLNLTKVFVHEGINDAAFDLLYEATMKELIPKKGPFLIFEAIRQEYLNGKAIFLSPVIFNDENESLTSYSSFLPTNSTINIINNEVDLPQFGENAENQKVANEVESLQQPNSSKRIGGSLFQNHLVIHNGYESGVCQ